MVSSTLSDKGLLYCDPQNVPRTSWTLSTDALLSIGKNSQQLAGNTRTLLTANDHPHIMHKTVDDLEGLHCGHPSLVLGESVQPLEHRIDYVLPEKLLNRFLCISLSQSQAIPKRKRTH
jgi:hypothetical protein